MPRLVDIIALAALCACYLANLGTLAGVDMTPLLVLVPLSVIYAYYSRYAERRDRRTGRHFPPHARRLTFLFGMYPAIGLAALFTELLLGRSEHGLTVFALLGVASLWFAYPAARALYALDRSAVASPRKIVT